MEDYRKMSDKELLFLVYGAVKAAAITDQRMKPIAELLEEHLMPLPVIQGASLPLTKGKK